MSAHDLFSLLTAVCLGLVLVSVILFDLRQMRIPNMLTYILIAFFGLTALVGPPMDDLTVRLTTAAIVLVLGFAGFVLRVFGGGDAKILASLSLFVPVAHLAVVMLLFSVALVIGTLAIFMARRLAGDGPTEWAFLHTRKLPMGLPIGIAGLTSPSAISLFG